MIKHGGFVALLLRLVCYTVREFYVSEKEQAREVSVMRTKKQRSHWFLKYPLVPAFVLPVFGILGVALLGQAVILVLLNVFGEGIRVFRDLPAIVNDVLRILLAFLMIAVMKRTNGGKFIFGFSSENGKLSFWLAAPALIVAASNLVEYSMAGLPFRASLGGVFYALLCGVAPGFFEEVACRGIPVGNMMQRWREKENYILRSVLASGIAFGLVHLINLLNGDLPATVLQVCYASAMGIFFGAVYVRTRSLWGPVIVHSIIDFTAFLFVGDPETSMFQIISAVITTIFYTAVGLYLIRREKREEIRKLWEGEEG